MPEILSRPSWNELSNDGTKLVSVENSLRDATSNTTYATDDAVTNSITFL